MTSTTHKLHGPTWGTVDHAEDLNRLHVILGADNTFVVAQALGFETGQESITTTLEGLRQLLALAETMEVQR